MKSQGLDLGGNMIKFDFKNNHKYDYINSQGTVNNFILFRRKDKFFKFNIASRTLLFFNGKKYVKAPEKQC